MSKILITGASGFIGSNLTRRLSKSKNEITIITKKHANLWRIKDILSKVDIQIGDLSGTKKIKNLIMKIKPDIVYHCAAYGVKPSQNNVINIIKYNLTGTANLLLSLEEYGRLERFVNLGSVFEYGTIPKTTERLDSIPPSPYGMAKKFQTQLVQYFAFKRRLPTVTLRIFTPYGFYEEAGRLIPDIMTALVQKNRLTVFSRSASRDFIFIDDVINAIIKAGKKENIDGEVFEIGSGKEYTVENIVNTACKVTKTKPEILWKDEKNRDYDKIDGKGYANIKKARKLGWQPKYTLNDGLLKTYEWFKENIHQYS